jgi:hypothetical protein
MSNVILIVGGAHQGKSTFLNKTCLKNNVQPNPANPEKNIYSVSNQSTRQYIFDVNNEYLFPVDNDGIHPIMRNVDLSMKDFINTCEKIIKTNVVIEDATGFLSGRMNDTFMRLLVKRAHSMNNYYLIFHALEQVPPNVMRMANYLCLFKTSDNPINVKKKFGNDKIDFFLNEVRSTPGRVMKTVKII